MNVRFRNPLITKEDCLAKDKGKDPYGDMPKLDYNCNVENSGDMEENLNLPCNCHRPASAVFCYKCGHIFTGRMRIQCERHPKVIHLMDSSHCPCCRGTSMKEYSN